MNAQLPETRAEGRHMRSAEMSGERFIALPKFTELEPVWGREIDRKSVVQAAMLLLCFDHHGAHQIPDRRCICGIDIKLTNDND